jgi:hypothetical protein
LLCHNCGYRTTRLLELSYGPESDGGCCAQDRLLGIPCCPVFLSELFVEIKGVFVSGEDGTWGMIWCEIGAVGVGVPE